jgi:hypothetical protein
MKSSTDASSPAPVRRPGLAKCRPERHDVTIDTGQWFTRWCNENQIDNRDLAEVLKCSLSVAAKKRSGESPITLVDIRLFKSRFRHLLMSMFLSWCDARAVGS